MGKRYDFEAHVYIPEFTGKFNAEEIRKANEKLPPEEQIKILDDIIDLDGIRLERMDKYGIDVQVLSFSSGIAKLPPEEAVTMSRLVNNRMYEAMQRHPGRFTAFAQLPEQDPQAACAELERCMKELGFFGWNTFSNFGTKHIDDPEYYPIFEKAAELGAVIYLHPDFPNADPRFQGWGRQLVGGLGYTLDTAITIIRLICSGLFDKLPNLKLILGHLGEGIPFYLERIGGKTETPESRLPALNQEPFTYYFAHNIWVTNSGNFSVPAYICARDVLGADRILFGSDYPYEFLEEAVPFTNSLPVSKEEIEGIYSGNALKAFPELG